jgi:uncharacterized protein YlzI (FlbEa/FlbD family)
MTNLPFVVEPRRKPIKCRIGTEESGVIEVERKGYLSTGEKAFFQQVQQADGSASEVITTSRKIARRHGLGMDRAYNLTISIISGAKRFVEGEEAELVEKIEEEFAEELTKALQSLAMSQTREDMIMATCMLRYRVNPNFDIESINKQHPDLIEGLAQLYRDEDRRSLEAFKEDEPEIAGEEQSIEEAEKKPRAVRKSPSKTTTGD